MLEPLGLAYHLLVQGQVLEQGLAYLLAGMLGQGHHLLVERSYGVFVGYLRLEQERGLERLVRGHHLLAVEEVGVQQRVPFRQE